MSAGTAGVPDIFPCPIIVGGNVHDINGMTVAKNFPILEKSQSKVKAG